MKKIVIPAMLLLTTLTCSVTPAPAATYAEEKKEAENFAHELILKRESASEELLKYGQGVSGNDFSSIYGRIYKKISEIREKKGFIVTYSAIKYRNPRSSATPFEARIMAKFRVDRDFKKFWTVTMVGGRSYSRLIKPVFAAKSCLTCHGAKGKRPAFIAKHYPEDKSFAFKEGDLMGLISVYMPDEED